MKIIVLNGPPGCGKDTLAGIIKNMLPLCSVRSFKDQMFEIVKATLPFPFHEFMARYEDRDLKEVPWSKLGWISPRRYMIKISEDWMKPTFGPDVFGKLAAKSAKIALNNGSATVVFSDSGFQKEFDSLQEEFGKSNVVLVKLIREGFGFEGDSRSYIHSEGSPCIEWQLSEGRQYEDASDILGWIIGKEVL